MKLAAAKWRQFSILRQIENSPLAGKRVRAGKSKPKTPTAENKILQQELDKFPLVVTKEACLAKEKVAEQFESLAKELADAQQKLSLAFGAVIEDDNSQSVLQPILDPPNSGEEQRDFTSHCDNDGNFLHLVLLQTFFFSLQCYQRFPFLCQLLR